MDQWTSTFLARAAFTYRFRSNGLSLCTFFVWRGMFESEDIAPRLASLASLRSDSNLIILLPITTTGGKEGPRVRLDAHASRLCIHSMRGRGETIRQVRRLCILFDRLGDQAEHCPGGAGFKDVKLLKLIELEPSSIGKKGRPRSRIRKDDPSHCVLLWSGQNDLVWITTSWRGERDGVLERKAYCKDGHVLRTPLQYLVSQ
jgi:hypothetical protein